MAQKLLINKLITNNNKHKTMKKLITNASHFLYALLATVLLVGCKKDQLYTTDECAKFKKGDTIYIHEFYHYDKVIVLNNSPEKELMEVRNLKYSWDIGIYSYDDVRFK